MMGVLVVVAAAEAFAAGWDKGAELGETVAAALAA